MQLKGKGKMRQFAYAAFFAALVSCSGEKGKELSEADQQLADSLSKVRQKEMADSMKRKNPLLILPPDSEYTGEYIDRYPGGLVKFKGYFRFGQRHGTWMSFYPNGLKWSEMHYEKGLRHGSNQTYYMNGQLRYEGFYKGDMQDSVWVYYDSTGKLAEKVLYSRDKIIKRLSK